MLNNKTINDLFTIKYEKVIDEFSDLSYLGEYTDRPDYNYYVVDRVEAGDYRGQGMEFRYWQSQFKADDPCAEYAPKDYKRHENYGQDWYMTGVIVTVQAPGGIKLGQASLWGIESDSNESCFDEVCATLEKEALKEAKKCLDDLKRLSL